MLSSLLKSQAIQLTKNDKFSKIIEQFGEKTLYELLIGDNKACIFKVKDTNNILNEEIDYLFYC